MRDYDEQRNLEDALAVADLFHALASLPMPVVARVHGAALGGGAGLLAVSDIVVAADDTQVGFTEARVGILPATIAPYVIRRIGIAAARTLFLRAHRMPATDAHRLGLIDEICPSADLDAVVRAASRRTRARGRLLASGDQGAARGARAAAGRGRATADGRSHRPAARERRWPGRPAGLPRASNAVVAAAEPIRCVRS